MTVYETIMVVLSMIGALISLSRLVIALLNFLDKKIVSINKNASLV